LRTSCPHLLFLSLPPPPPSPTLFPYTTLFRSLRPGHDDRRGAAEPAFDPSRAARRGHVSGQDDHADGTREPVAAAPRLPLRVPRDRKSTRLNSSHVSISYAVFCLKKKKKKT